MAEGAEKPRNLEEYENLARKRTAQTYFQYYNYPGTAGQTSTDSIAAFKRYRFRPQLMNDVSTRKLSTTLLGKPVSLPIGVAPTAFHRWVDTNGEISTAIGASAVGSAMIQSSFSAKHVRDVRAAVPHGVLWKNIHIWKDRRITKALIKAAEEAGYDALVITVDSPMTAVDTDEFRRNYMLYNHRDMRYPLMDLGLEEQEEAKRQGDENMILYFASQYDASVTWKDIQWLKTLTSLPIVCKGILTGRAARQAVEAGANGIIVSAHGGRQLDGVPASIDALAEVVEAVRGRNVEVYMDGGIRNGTDVLKALARGAKAVFVGRPILWGLACGGAAGVEHVLTILRTELDFAMALCGCSDVNAIPSDVVVHESFYNISKSKL
ncbi:hydroxyacid oxidase 1-like [Lytechinus variegatus]|uniref:hydroxyacid oxidase 1-like n=1 Tax=Lytechinus variegatus TaxID=7654 RepID=UPI001BB22DBE|nr:hydroxyacid oxidase 1-like [Lytechinus variegatus]